MSQMVEIFGFGMLLSCQVSGEGRGETLIKKEGDILNCTQTLFLAIDL